MITVVSGDPSRPRSLCCELSLCDEQEKHRETSAATLQQCLSKQTVVRAQNNEFWIRAAPRSEHTVDNFENWQVRDLHSQIW